jgi:hypothetical protein
MRHLKNRSLENCLVFYQFVNLKLFHPEQRNFDQTDRYFFIPVFLDNDVSLTIFDTEILRFEITYNFNLAHACYCSPLKGFYLGWLTAFRANIRLRWKWLR